MKTNLIVKQLAAAVLMLCFAGAAYAVPETLYLYNDMQSPMQDQNGVALQGYSTYGDRIEVIWTGANGIIDDINLIDYSPGGDDLIIVDIHNNQAGVSHVGYGFPEGYTDGNVSMVLEQIPLENYTEGSFYVRAFNVADPVSALETVYWGHSNLFTVFDVTYAESGLDWNLGFFEFSFNGTDQSTTAIPEPATLILLLISILGIGKRLMIK